MKETVGKFTHTLILDKELLGKIEDAKKEFLPYSHRGLSRNAFLCHLLVLGLERLAVDKKRK